MSADVGTQIAEVNCSLSVLCSILQGAVSGSVQASDRLMKELREIYRSQSYKTGMYIKPSFCFVQHERKFTEITQTMMSSLFDN